MKTGTILFSAIFGLVLMAAFAAATPEHSGDGADTVTITNPEDDDVTGPSLYLNATSTIDATCFYKLKEESDEDDEDDESYDSWIIMEVTGGTEHSHYLSGLDDGEYDVHVHCCEAEQVGKKECGQAMNDHVDWEVRNGNPPAIPEFPSSAIPALLSLASFGVVSRLKTNKVGSR